MPKRTILIKQYHSPWQRVSEVSIEPLDLADDELEPTNIIDRKTEAVADLLGCTYEEAERIILNLE